MAGMLATAGVIVRHGVGEGIVHAAAAVGPSVDVEAKDARMAGAVGFRQTADLGPDNDPLVGLVKPHGPG